MTGRSGEGATILFFYGNIIKLLVPRREGVNKVIPILVGFDGKLKPMTVRVIDSDAPFNRNPSPILQKLLYRLLALVGRVGENEVPRMFAMIALFQADSLFV